MATKSYVGDIGTEIIVDVGCDITDATEHKLLIKKPDLTEEEWTPTSIFGTQYLTYTVADGDFDQAGKYKLQAWVKTPDGEWYGETAEFRVYDEFR